MSSAIVRIISASERPLAIIFATGFAAAGVQTLFLREYLSVFSGNEIVIGIVLALWLCATAAGCLAGARGKTNAPGDPTRLLTAYFFTIIAGLLAIRAVRLLYGPGETVPPGVILAIVLTAQSAPAFYGGFFFGRLTKNAPGEKLYVMENAGWAAGLAVVSLCVLFRLPNGFSIAVVLAAMAIIVLRRRWLLPGLLAACGLLVLFDPFTMAWKYGKNVHAVSSGHEGEIAVNTEMELTFLNNVLYRTGKAAPSIEQSVHIPVAMHENRARRALVIGNNGQVAELGKYGGADIECLETEPLLATGVCRCAAIESYRGTGMFDVVLLGGGFPETVGRSRFFTLTFFKKVHALTGGNGVFSFTLPFSENYLSPPEKRLKDMLQATLAQVFHNVKIVPGTGYTFVASDRPLRWPVRVSVKTDYLESHILPSITPGRIAVANAITDSLTVNTQNRPLALLSAQKRWLGSFGIPAGVFQAMFAIVFILGLPLLLQSRAALSVGTTGFVAGVYSMALLLIFQAVHGTLYSQFSLFMIALSAGFAIGGRMRRMPAPDLMIGMYATVTLYAMTMIDSPPLALFLLLHAGMGFLAGAQFATRRKVSSWGGLYAADLAGGVFGTALCATALLPLFGVTGIALGLGAVKAVSAVVGRNE